MKQSQSKKYRTGSTRLVIDGPLIEVLVRGLVEANSVVDGLRIKPLEVSPRFRGRNAGHGREVHKIHRKILGQDNATTYDGLTGGAAREGLEAPR